MRRSAMGGRQRVAARRRRASPIRAPYLRAALAVRPALRASLPSSSATRRRGRRRHEEEGRRKPRPAEQEAGEGKLMCEGRISGRGGAQGEHNASPGAWRKRSASSIARTSSAALPSSRPAAVLQRPRLPELVDESEILHALAASSARSGFGRCAPLSLRSVAMVAAAR